MHLLQRKHNTSQRCMKGSRQTGTRTAGKQNFLFAFVTFECFRNTFSSHRTKLYRRAFSSQRQTGKQRQKSSQEFRRKHFPPNLIQLSDHLTFHLRNTTSGNHRFPVQQFSYNKSKNRQNPEPSCHAQRIAAAVTQNHIQPITGIRQSNAIRQHDKTADNTYKKALADQIDLIKTFFSPNQMGCILFHRISSLDFFPFYYTLPLISLQSFELSVKVLFIGYCSLCSQ